MIQLHAELGKWLHIAGQSETLDAECDDAWESWVTQPCIETPLAPRQARAALEILGYFASQGMSVKAMLKRIVEECETLSQQCDLKESITDFFGRDEQSKRQPIM